MPLKDKAAANTLPKKESHVAIKDGATKVLRQDAFLHLPK